MSLTDRERAEAEDDVRQMVQDMKSAGIEAEYARLFVTLMDIAVRQTYEERPKLKLVTPLPNRRGPHILKGE